MMPDIEDLETPFRRRFSSDLDALTIDDWDVTGRFASMTEYETRGSKS